MIWRITYPLAEASGNNNSGLSGLWSRLPCMLTTQQQFIELVKHRGIIM